MIIDRAVQTRLEPDNQVKLLEPKVQSVNGGFPFSKTDTGGSSVGFASPKPEQLEPDWSYKNIQPNLAKTSQIRRDLDQI